MAPTGQLSQARKTNFLQSLPANRTPQREKTETIEALQAHRINTIAELRRVERVLASAASPDITGPMTAACKSRMRNLEYALSNADII